MTEAEQQEQQAIEAIRARKADFEAQYNAVQAQISASVSRGNPTPGNHRFSSIARKNLAVASEPGL